MNQLQQEQYTGKGGIYQQLTLPISENILIDEHEPVYTFHVRRSIIALTTRLHFPDGWMRKQSPMMEEWYDFA